MTLEAFLLSCEMSYKILNWNVNGLRARWDQLKSIMADDSYDIIALQETKCEYEQVDYIVDELKALGYTLYLNPHPDGYHGTGIIIKSHLQFWTGMHVHGRVQEVYGTDFRLINVYVNQGQAVDSPEYPIKLELMSELKKLMTRSSDTNLIVLGDFNICPEDEHVWDVGYWHDEVISRTPPEVESFNQLAQITGIRNVPVANDVKFTWYPYRHTWRKYQSDQLVEHTGKYGIKCDHVLTNMQAVSEIALLDYCRLPKIKSDFTTSDHVPMVIEIR